MAGKTNSNLHFLWNCFPFEISMYLVWVRKLKIMSMTILTAISVEAKEDMIDDNMVVITNYILQAVHLPK